MQRNTDTPGIGFWSAVAIGIGGMVGGGIFAVLGLSVQLARGAAPIAFALAGLVALVTARSYARLSVAYPSQGGTVTFLYQAFGPGLFTGTANVLLWLSYIVMLSLYAHAFGSYGARLFPSVPQALMTHVLISFVILAITGLNMGTSEQALRRWHDVQKARKGCCVAQPRLAALARRAARLAGFLDVTHAYQIKTLGRFCLSASPRYTGLTGSQPAGASVP